MGVYTNGFRQQEVLSVLKGRLGWGGSNLSTNTESASGRKFDDGSFHPIVTVTNIAATAETPGLTGDALEEYLDAKETAVTMQALTAVFTSPEVKDDTKLFERSDTSSEQPVYNEGNFVFIRFTVPSKGIALQVAGLLLNFDKAFTLTLYLYREGVRAFEWSEQVNYTGMGVEEFEPTTELIMSKGGIYYLGYYQNEVEAAGANAIDENPCHWNPARSFGYAFGQSKQQGEDFNRRGIGITSRTFGLNAQVVAFADYTDLIKRSAASFDSLIGYMMAAHIGKQVIYAVRSNSAERILKDAVSQAGLVYDIDGTAPIPDIPKGLGISGRIKDEIKRLKETFFPKAKPMTVSVC